MKLRILFTLLYLNVFSQVKNIYEIDYVCTRNLNFKVQTNDKLFYDLEKKISYYKEGEYKTIENSGFILPENSVLIEDKDTSNSDYIYIKFSENIIYDNTEPYNTYYTFSEEIPKIHWIITNNTKISNNIELTKATTTFRGRDYEVWFSYEYPLPIGPWKFNGLPGLIFEVIDKTEPYNYHWQLKKITTKKSVLPFSGKNIKNILSNKEFLLKFKDEHMSSSDIILSRLNIEYTPSTLEEKEKSFNNYRLLKREIKYEWEN